MKERDKWLLDTPFVDNGRVNSGGGGRHGGRVAPGWALALPVTLDR